MRTILLGLEAMLCMRPEIANLTMSAGAVFLAGCAAPLQSAAIPAHRIHQSPFCVPGAQPVDVARRRRRAGGFAAEYLSVYTDDPIESMRELP